MIMDEVIELEHAICVLVQECEELRSSLFECPHCACGQKLERISQLEGEIDLIKQQKSEMEIENEIGLEEVDETEACYVPEYEYDFA